MLRCYFTFANVSRDSLYQYDTNQTLNIISSGFTKAPVIEFCNTQSKVSITKNATLTDDGFTCDVPNSLLAEPYDIIGYVCLNSSNGRMVHDVIRIPVIKRVMPEGYEIPIEIPKIIISSSSLKVYENESIGFDVSLSMAPDKDMIVTLSVNNKDTTLDKTELTFTPKNYKLTQRVILSVGDDEDSINGSALITLSGKGVETATISVSIIDDDVIEWVTPTLDDWTYSIVGNELYLKSYTGSDKAINIPVSYAIDEKIYNPIYMWNISIPTNVNYINIEEGVKAYSGYGLGDFSNHTGITAIFGMAEGATGYPRFINATSLASIPQMPEGLTAFSKNFWGCTELTDVSKVTFPESLTNFHDAFANNTSLIRGCVVPPQATIADQLFYGCKNLTWARIESKIVPYNSGFLQGGTNGECIIEMYTDSVFFENLKKLTPLQSWGTTNGSNFYIEDIENDLISVSCFGDSLTHGQNQTPNYPTVLDELLPNNSIVYNYGFGGSTMENIRDRMLSHPGRLKKDIVIIWAGTNGSTATATIDTRLACTDEMIDALNTDKYIILTPVKTSYSSAIDSAYREKYGDKFFSLRDWFDNNGYTITDYMSDTTHFNGEGNTLIGKAIYQKIVELEYLS